MGQGPSGGVVTQQQQKSSTHAPPPPVQNKMNLQGLPIRAYLDQTVVPLLLDGTLNSKYEHNSVLKQASFLYI